MTCRKLLALVVCALVVTGCASTPHVISGSWIQPGEAVLRAAGAPRLGIPGDFVMTVKATGGSHRLFLNSETDYRDPRNLSIAIEPAAASQLAAQLGAPPRLALRGKRILVAGTARRTRIDFIVHGKPSGKYYYQTHVAVTDASQIQVLSDGTESSTQSDEIRL